MRARVPWILHIVSFIVAGFAFLPGRFIPYTSQWPLFESLRTTASIIFAILGAWIAVVYPTALTRILTWSKPERDGELMKLDNLMRAVFFSAIIVAVVIVLGPLATVLKLSPWFLDHSTTFRGILFSGLTYLTLAQLWTLILSIVPAELLNIEVQKSFGHQDNVESFKRLKPTR